MKSFRSLKMKYLRYHNRSLFLIDATFNLFFLAILVPFAGQIIKLIMKLSKISYITQENALTVLTSFHALLLLLFLGILLLLFLLIKLIAYIYYCNTEGSLDKPYIINFISAGVYPVVQLLRQTRGSLLLLVLPYYIFATLPVLSGIIVHMDIELTSGVYREGFVKVLLLFLLLLISYFTSHGMFTFHFCIYEKIGIRKALKLSRQLQSGKRRKTLMILFGYNLMFFLLFSVFYYMLLLITAIGVYLFGNHNLSVTIFLSAYPRINLYATLLFSMITLIFNINLTTSLFHTYRSEDVRALLPEYPEYEYRFSYRSQAHKWMINGILLLFIMIGTFNLYSVVHNDSSYFAEALMGTVISSHRGNSRIAPENTLPAIESAILAGSDYVEIDVQQSKSGTLLLMHDRNLKRTSGKNNFIWELTDEELNELDVGSWFSMDYIDTRIPTLEEVLSYCKDRIKLNIELKVNGDYTGAVKQLVDLIEEYNYKDQCVVTSTNYPALKAVKRQDENIRTGYILSVVYGNFYEKEHVDFFSIRYNFINQNVVKSAHLAGKEIHAWTVNTSRQMESMKSAGVDAIITDNPSLAREVLYRDNTNDNFIQLIYRMLKNRSFYQVSQFVN